ncbi:MAG: hypothetical protein HY966_00895 [Ignavibacteriales bacterium]|nr:hypothetical protein [Ignavibacteriales bacterium]
MEKMIMDERVREVVAGDVKLKEAVRKFERRVILEELHRNNEDKEKVARLLGISLSSLYRKLTDMSSEPQEAMAFDTSRNN